MALVQYLGYKSYFDYYKEKLSQDEKVILDNGAYEGAMGTHDELYRWVHELKPTAVVLPDQPGNYQRTLKLSENFLKKGVFCETMYVVHTDGKITSSVDSYKEGLQLGTTWLGFSRLTQTYGLYSSYRWTRRGNFVVYLKERGLWQPRKLHALGMSNGAVAELKQLQKTGLDGEFDTCFHSIDSSSPVWRGLHGYSLDSRSWPNYGFDPMATHFDASNWPCAKLNLEEVYLNCK